MIQSTRITHKIRVKHLYPERTQEKPHTVSASLGHSDRLQRLEDRQRLLSHLVLALICVLLVVGCCFFRLLAYTMNSNPSKQEYISPRPTQQVQTFPTSDEVSTEIPPVAMKSDTPEKPAALLTGSHYLRPNGSVVLWSTQGDAFLHQMDYKDGRLIVKQEGFYFLYSKIGLTDTHCELVKHKMMRSPRFGDGLTPMELMLSTRYHCPKKSNTKETADVRNSYLGGVFHLYVNDLIYVEVEGQVQIRLRYAETLFGAFML